MNHVFYGNSSRMQSSSYPQSYAPTQRGMAPTEY